MWDVGIYSDIKGLMQIMGIKFKPQSHSQQFCNDIRGPYADHILIPQGSTGSSIFFDIK